jgi:TfoX/Sxy family transcriptional regulator of competence genes
MPFDEELADRVRSTFARKKNVAEKKMFGGVGWLLNGNMCVGVWKRWLIARLGDAYTDALREPNVREFDITGKAMSGWVMVEPEGVAADDELRDWVNRCVAFVRTLPAKD